MLTLLFKLIIAFSMVSLLSLEFLMFKLPPRINHPFPLTKSSENS
ncbi:Uncharacterised protein [Serratia fonticola]|uniref:Uncharacterized protein n=1 Tax=Serratia fonticola TaxID=47917 RepID=A0A4U9TDM9_SERFO|nr:Uncharacterised protein [Serratia fonticola]